MILAFLVGLACAFFGSMPIAGPVGVLIVERGLSGHGRSAFGLAVGNAVGEAGYALLAFLGMTAALSRFPWMVPASRVLGALILLGLGLYFALGPRRQTDKEGDDAPRRRGRDGLWLGLVVTALNPTLIVTWSAVVTILHSTGVLRVEPLDAFPFAIGVVGGGVGWFGILLAIMTKLHRSVKPTTLDRVVRVLGWILVAAGAGVVIRIAIVGLTSH